MTTHEMARPMHRRTHSRGQSRNELLSIMPAKEKVSRISEDGGERGDDDDNPWRQIAAMCQKPEDQQNGFTLQHRAQNNDRITVGLSKHSDIRHVSKPKNSRISFIAVVYVPPAMASTFSRRGGCVTRPALTCKRTAVRHYHPLISPHFMGGIKGGSSSISPCLRGDKRGVILLAPLHILQFHFHHVIPANAGINLADIIRRAGSPHLTESKGSAS
jgi:hypothetical protein